MKNAQRETIRSKLKEQESRLNAEYRQGMQANRAIYDRRMADYEDRLARFIKESREAGLVEFRKDAYVRELESQVETLRGLVSYASRGNPVELPDSTGIGDMSINEAIAAGKMAEDWQEELRRPIEKAREEREDDDRG